MIKILSPFIFIFSLHLSAQAQKIDSTWVKGTRTLADGYYVSGIPSYSNLLVTDYLDSDNSYLLSPQLVMSIDNLKASIMENHNGDKFIALTFPLTYHSKWASMTRGFIGRDFALIVNNQLVQVLRVNAEVQNGRSVINRNDLTESQLLELHSSITDRLSLN